jgi:hypothetical protein
VLIFCLPQWGWRSSASGARGIVPTFSPEGDLLKTLVVMPLCILALAGAVIGQGRTIKIALKPTSTTPPAYLLQNLPPVGCPNVQIVSDESTADFLLEAQGGDFEGPGGSEGGHPPRAPRPKAHYTLYQNGAVVFGTTPIKEKNAVKDLCKFLQKGSSK